MSTLFSGISDQFSQKRQALQAMPVGELCSRGIFWTLVCYIVTFSWGFGIREVLPCIGGIFLFALYKYDWKSTTLSRFPLKWTLAVFGLSLVWAVVMSRDPWESFLHIGRGFNKQFLVFFLALECVRTEKDLRHLVYALTAGLFIQGWNCVYQHCTGLDFIQHDPLNAGRLTGSFGDYWVGNWFALTMVPACGLWYLLRRKLPRPLGACLCIAVFLPAVYGMVFAGARNAYIILFGAMTAACLYRQFRLGRKNRSMWIFIALAACAVAAMSVCGLQRGMSAGAVQGDGRWSLWELAIAVFRDSMITGAGAGQYNAAFRALGLAPLKDAITISHPHDIYLQLLCETGIVGTLLTLVPLAVIFLWIERRLCPMLRTEYALPPSADGPLYARLTFLFALGFFAFLISGIVGHDFYRPWYLAVALGNLGIALGAVLRRT